MCSRRARQAFGEGTRLRSFVFFQSKTSRTVSWCHQKLCVLYLLQRMPGTPQSFRVLRGSMAACLALLLSIASLAPLAAGVLRGSSGACCRGLAGHCCKKAHLKPPAGQTFTASSCGSDCGQFTAARAGMSGVMESSSRSLTPPSQTRARAYAGQSSAASDFSNDALRQRPPPISRLVFQS